MNEETITSRDNSRARHARAVRSGKIPDEIFIEGLRLCEEVANSQLELREIFHTEEMTSDERGARLLLNLKASRAQTNIVSEQVFNSLSDTKSPQGIILLAARPQTASRTFENISEELPLLVILHRLNNPSNAGAILRTAEAAGATGIICTTGTTDLFSPKALRGAMGSSFRLPLWTGAEFTEALDWCTARGISTICADARAQQEHTAHDWRRPCALIVGAEAHGLDESEIALAGKALKIPMRPPVESLNVAVATAIILYEAARQRNQ